jgi:hypothetical protein
MEKIVEDVKSLVVNQWKDGGMIRPYVEEKIFELFRLAYDRARESGAGMITGDMLTDRLAPEIYAIDDKKPENSKDEFIDRLRCKWDAWRLALDNYPHRHPMMEE